MVNLFNFRMHGLETSLSTTELLVFGTGRGQFLCFDKSLCFLKAKVFLCALDSSDVFVLKPIIIGGVTISGGLANFQN